jgi:hypothetical protein
MTAAAPGSASLFEGWPAEDHHRSAPAEPGSAVVVYVGVDDRGGNRLGDPVQDWSRAFWMLSAVEEFQPALLADDDR